MEICNSVEDLRTIVGAAKGGGKKIGFVPTMGALHSGHLSLVKLAQQHSDMVVVSVFVNPTQFNVASDFEAYPSNRTQDSEMLKERGVDCAFFPSTEQCYQPGHQSIVEVPSLSSFLEGAFRPGHFKGVTTIVAMLFNMVAPDVAVFGDKDFQQLRVIEQLVLDLKFPIQIVRAPTMREESGLALSSRNSRLSKQGKQHASMIIAGLRSGLKLFQSGERSSEKIIGEAAAVVKSCGHVTIEYLTVVNSRNAPRIARGRN